jgi:hypothetical protein
MNHFAIAIRRTIRSDAAGLLRTLCRMFAVALLTGCSDPAPSPEVVTDSTGTYRLIRPETQGPQGTINIALWSKDGVSTNKLIYMRRQLGEGHTVFTGIQP